MKFDKKHRPHTLADVIFAEADTRQTLDEYANNQRDKHLLLYGPKGTGKSVSAQLVLKERMGVIWQTGLGDPWNAKAYQEKHDGFEPALRQWNMQLSMGAHTGCTVFDELDQFTLPMQHKLRAFIDQYEMGMVIATTNHLHLIDGPLKDRFRPIFVTYPSITQWVPRVVSVMEAENMPITPAQAAGLMRGFEGSGRKLDDWIEDCVFRVQRIMTKVTTPPTQPYAQTVDSTGDQ